MAEINLLPTDLAAKSPIKKTADVLKKVAIGGFVLLFLFLIGSGAYLYFLNLQVRNSVANQEELKQSIESLEQTEQQLVIVRDRLDKAETVLGKESAAEELEDFEELAGLIPPTVAVTEADMVSGRSEVSLIAVSSSGLVQLMANLISLELYERIELTSFGFTPGSGYLVSLVLLE